MKYFGNFDDMIFGFAVAGNYQTSSTDEVEKYVINPEWKKKQQENRINLLKQQAEHYQSQINHLISLKGNIESEIKKLEKELKKIE